MELVNLAYKSYVFSDERQPLTIQNVISIEKSKNNMQEIVTTDKGETVTVELRGLRATVVKKAEEISNGPETTTSPN
jgi:acetamidase/formamidase